MIKYTNTSADFSECLRYRYVLRRDWSEGNIAMCVGLNPSTANGTKDDPTIRRLVSALQHIGYGGLRMTNLYAYITSNPMVLFDVRDSLGSNDEWLQTTAYQCQDIIFCWGSFRKIDARVRKVIKMFPDGKCFGKNSDGAPWHPLSLMYRGVANEDVKLTKYVFTR